MEIFYSKLWSHFFLSQMQKKGKKLYFGQKENKGRRKQWRGEDKRWKVPLNPGHLLPHVSASLSDSHCSHAAQTPVR